MNRTAPVLKMEPGSWVMFLVSWWTGAAMISIRHAAPVATPFSILVFISFSVLLLVKPLVSAALKQRTLRPVIYIALPPLMVIAWSAWLRPQLVPFYLAGGVLMALYFAMERRSHFYSEIVGMAVMGLAAAISVIANGRAGGPLSGVLLGLMFFAFFLSSPLRVRLTAPKYRRAAVIYSGCILAASVWLGISGRPVFFAFLPLAEDFISALTRSKREQFRIIGMTESIKTLIFAALLIIFF